MNHKTATNLRSMINEVRKGQAPSSRFTRETTMNHAVNSALLAQKEGEIQKLVQINAILRAQNNQLRVRLDKERIGRKLRGYDPDEPKAIEEAKEYIVITMPHTPSEIEGVDY